MTIQFTDELLALKVLQACKENGALKRPIRREGLFEEVEGHLFECTCGELYQAGFVTGFTAPHPRGGIACVPTAITVTGRQYLNDASRPWHQKAKFWILNAMSSIGAIIVSSIISGIVGYWIAKLTGTN